MKIKLAFLAFLLCFSLLAYAEISATEAAKFVGEESHFLYENETVEQPNLKIKHASTDYWVFPAISGDSISTFFAVKTSGKELSTDRATNRKLFETAYFIKEYAKEKEKASKSTQLKWIMSSAVGKRFETLGRLLNDETFQLNTISTTLNDNEITQSVSVLKGQLVELSRDSASIAEKINGAIADEAELTSEPTTESKEKMKKSFDEVFGMLDDLEQLALDYSSNVNKLKQKISVIDTEAETKSFLINLAKPPENFNDIGSISLDAATEKEAIEQLFVKTSTQIDNMLDEFEGRLERTTTYDFLYSQNKDLIKIDSKFTSIKKAAEIVLDEANRPNWKESQKVKQLEKNWKDAELFFRKGDFKFAEDSAKKAADDVRVIYKAGFIEKEEKPVISNDLINKAIMALIFILIALIIFNKRGKIIGMFGPKKEEEEKVSMSKSWE